MLLKALYQEVIWYDLRKTEDGIEILPYSAFTAHLWSGDVIK